MAHTLAAGTASGQVRVHRSPKPLSADAVTHDWASFLGPSHNAVSTETKLSRTLPPPLVWELAKGSGYASPAIAGEHLVFLHRVANEEIVECLHPEAGSHHWQFRYATAFEDRYGYNNGPRSSPVIDVEGKRVYTMGAEGKLHCLEIGSGTVVWKHDLRAEYGVRQDFFGTASTPLLEGGLLNRQRRRAGWTVCGRAGRGYGARSVARRYGVGSQLRVPRAGGGARSTTGVRVRGGRVQSAERRPDVDRPGHGRRGFHLSVPEPHVRISQCSLPGCVRRPGVHFGELSEGRCARGGAARLHAQGGVDHTGVRAALQHADSPDGYLYGFDGRNMGDASLACVDAASGQVVWREVPEWRETFELGGRPRRQLMGTARGSLLAADGSSCAWASWGTYSGCT